MSEDMPEKECQAEGQKICQKIMPERECYLERKWIIRKNVYQEEYITNCSSMNGRLRKIQLVHIGNVSFL